MGPVCFFIYPDRGETVVFPGIQALLRVRP
jgi:hypothetical protein